MPKPEKHVFICTQARPQGHPRGSCAERGCQAMAEAFWMQMQERNLFERFAVTSTGCLGPCHVGPNVLIYPEGVMYSGVTAEAVPQIIEKHLLGGEVIDELLAPSDVWS